MLLFFFWLLPCCLSTAFLPHTVLHSEHVHINVSTCLTAGRLPGLDLLHLVGHLQCCYPQRPPLLAAALWRLIFSWLPHYITFSVRFFWLCALYAIQLLRLSGRGQYAATTALPCQEAVNSWWRWQKQRSFVPHLRIKLSEAWCTCTHVQRLMRSMCCTSM